METILTKISIMLVPALMAVTFHEISHGFAAERLGDPTARLLGRLTPNPLRHLDPIGTIALLVFGFGWARPVPVNFNNLRNPKRDMMWVALAGPSSNLLLALLSAFFLRGLEMVSGLMPPGQEMIGQFIEPLALMAGFSLYINVILCVFNLIPLPPLDGGRVMVGLLPQKQSELLARIEPFGFILVILLIFFTDLYRVVLAPVILTLVDFMAGSQQYLVYQSIDFLFGR
ncbi:site-2 protease family protein [Geoalkalibacter subterraneus]|jgi:Zn-dependent protease|uniref:Peptidase n=1 Tax=Geoalkalibacter subterraneus TaxID=483547 RepID=A0A0B5FG95_9BACT|nr:site-2 protease family protein [Geoalkalibacter subterraneus]AJF06348.1 peptidase [Geoalkalibacter subterraneus]